jgi:hypothetical protein
MKFLFDENMGHQIPAALKCLGKDTYHVSEFDLINTPDVDIIEFCGENEYYFVTMDKRIRYNDLEKKAILNNNVGVFFIRGNTEGTWYWVRQIINHWVRIEQWVSDNQTPFVVKVPSLNGTKMEPYQLD